MTSELRQYGHIFRPILRIFPRCPSAHVVDSSRSGKAGVTALEAQLRAAISSVRQTREHASTGRFPAKAVPPGDSSTGPRPFDEGYLDLVRLPAIRVPKTCLVNAGVPANALRCLGGEYGPRISGSGPGRRSTTFASHSSVDNALLIS
jgi:hypothetical protein